MIVVGLTIAIVLWWCFESLVVVFFSIALGNANGGLGALVFLHVCFNHGG